jgi:hypothetical protein
MASNTRITWKRRTRKHVNMGKKRKAKESRKSTPSAVELFATLGPPEGKAGAPAAKQK